MEQSALVEPLVILTLVLNFNIINSCKGGKFELFEKIVFMENIAVIKKKSDRVLDSLSEKHDMGFSKLAVTSW